MWRVRFPWPVALGLGLVPVLFTTVGFVVAQVAGFDDRRTYLSAAAAVTARAVLGLVVMRLSPPTLRAYGLRSVVGVRDALWFLPAAVIPVLVYAATGVGVSAALFGVVAAELYVVTRSLVPSIVWHAVYDFTAYVGGDALSTAALVGLAAETAILVAYAGWLWRRLPR